MLKYLLPGGLGVAVETCKHTPPYCKALRLYAKLHGLYHTSTLGTIFKHKEVCLGTQLRWPGVLIKFLGKKKQLNRKGWFGSQFKGRVHQGGKGTKTGTAHIGPQLASKTQWVHIISLHSPFYPVWDSGTVGHGMVPQYPFIPITVV